MENFFQRLERRSKDVDSLLCVGLDPHPAQLEDKSAAGAAAFCIRLIEETAAFAAAFKPNIAFFEAHGSNGTAALQRVIGAVPAGIPVLLDAKRGDIGSTAAAYAEASFSVLKAHAITLSPYMGGDSLQPFLDDATRGSFILCKTSNPGSNDLQILPVAGAATVFEEVAKLAQDRWNSNGNVGLVVGATDTVALTKARAAAPDLWILAPGVGFQGGDLAETVACAIRPDGLGLLLPVSRGISKDADPRAAAMRLRDAINEAKAAALAVQAPSAVGLSSKPALAPFQAEFIEFALGLGVLKFGSFTLKSGRKSPYFFNAGLFRTGAALAKLGRFYAQAINASNLSFDVLFGPAYKGIPLVSSIAIAMSTDRDVDFAYNRKEAKDHGEGGLLVGAPVAAKRCLLVDDVISAGTAVREAVGILQAESAALAGVVIALDRQEKTGAEGGRGLSATQQVEQDLGVPVLSIVTLAHMLEWAKDRGEMKENAEAIAEYRQMYGVLA